jgi:hypothetical protein
VNLKIVVAAVLVASPALAQTATTQPNGTAPIVFNQGSPTVNSGPGATGSISTEATGAGTISNNPAGAGNAQMPSRRISTPSGSGQGQ